MRSRTFMAAMFLLSATGIAIAQQAPSGQSAPENSLPPVVVTTPAKPKPGKVGKNAKSNKNAGQTAAKKPATSGEEPSPAAASSPSADLLPPPGTLIHPSTAFNPVTATGERELEATHGATLTDTLQAKPGLIGSTFAPGANRPIIRGLDNNRVRIQENGTTTGDVSDLSEDHAIPIDPYSADKLEVVRGPATLRYGSQAIGGVVSVENQRVPTFMPEHGVSAEVTGGLSSVDDGRDGAFKVTAGSQGFVVHADGFNRQTDDYDTPHGVQENSFVDSKGGSGGASYVWSDGFFGVAYTRFESLYAIPGIESVEEKSRIDMTQDKINARGEWRARDRGIEAIRSWFGWTDYAHNELDFDAAAGEDAVGSRFTNKQYEGRFEVELVPLATSAGPLRSVAGMQFGNRKLIGLSFEGDNLLEPNTTGTIGGFLFEELQLAKQLRVQAAGRIEHDDVSGATFADIANPTDIVARDLSFDPKSASLGALYDLPGGIVARLSGQYAERAPVAQELFSKGAHDATGTFEIGDPDIGIEKSKTIELGFNQAHGPLRFDSSVYFTKFDGFIFRQLTGETCDATIDSCSPGGGGGDLKQVIFGQRDATFYGAELAAEYDVAPIWNGLWGVSGQYDFVRAEFSGGENVPRMPPHRLGGGLYYRDRAWQARVNLLHAFEQDEIGENETPTNSYTLLGAEASYTLALDGSGAVVPKLVIGVKGENLLDDDVRNSASFKKDEVLQPGASVRLFGSVIF